MTDVGCFVHQLHTTASLQPKMSRVVNTTAGYGEMWCSEIRPHLCLGGVTPISNSVCVRVFSPTGLGLPAQCTYPSARSQRTVYAVPSSAPNHELLSHEPFSLPRVHFVYFSSFHMPILSSLPNAESFYGA